MDIDSIIRDIRESPHCIIHPSGGMPIISREHTLPNDLKRFYEQCGGISLFPRRDYAIEIISAAGLVLANPIIIGESCQDDITASWYILGRSDAQEMVTIDLSERRLGRCYDSFWDRHGVPGDCAIIANSFTELVARLFAGGGDYWYWLRDDFERIGDAYDDLG